MKVKDIIRHTEWISNPQTSAKPPKFSIMMPTYRRFASGHLTRAIQSVLNQTFNEFELILIDDGSVDGSFDEIQRFMKLDSRIHCLHHPRNIGLPAIGCYEALLKSQGEYLMFCFDDTEYQKDALEKVDRYVSDHNPKICFGYIDYQYRNSDGKISHSYLGKDQISQAHLRMTNFLPNLGAILHRDVPNEIGFLDPHIAVARVTDWDYWKRAAKVYELYYSGIHVGTELGLVTSNSLGLTYPLDSWMAYEWTERDRNLDLIPGRYEEYDVLQTPKDFSDGGKLALRDLSRFYSSKFWYQHQGALTVLNKSTTDQLDLDAKLLVVTSAQNPSIPLSFEFIPHTGQSIRYVSPTYHRPEDMIDASAVIIVNDLLHPEISRWIKIARYLGIPHYYYLDEDPIVHSDENLEAKEYTKKKLKKELASFSGVLVTDQKLATFFDENNIHSTIYIFPQVMPSIQWLDNPNIPKKSGATIRIGYVNNSQNFTEFIEYVIPAITKLANSHKVELVISGAHKFPADNFPQLKIYQMKLDTSCQLSFGRMQSADLDILLHLDNIANNGSTKVPNILLSAWALNTIPVVFNRLLSKDIEALQLGLLCNDADELYEILLNVVSDQIPVVLIKNNLLRYITEHYSGEHNSEILKTIQKTHITTGISMVGNRFRNYIHMLETGVLSSGNTLAVGSAIRLVRKLEYKLHSHYSHWSGFEFMVGTNQQKVFGKIDIEVLDPANRTIIRNKTVDMKDIKDNQLVLVDFEEIPNSTDKEYIIRFYYYQSSARSSIFVYETNSQESNIKRLLRRTGLLTRGNTLACHLLYANN